MQIGLSQRIVLGAPGCGKTTRLLAILEDEMNMGVSPNRVAYVSFTRKAVKEAQDRAAIKFGFSYQDMPYYKTVHSLCFQQLGATKRDVIGSVHLDEIAKLLGIQFTGAYDEDGTGMPTGGADGDAFLFLDNLARAREENLQTVYHEQDNPPFSWYQLKQFSDTLREYKRDTGLMDFTDMLSRYVESGIPIDVDVAVIDEAQDLSRLQWRVIKKAFQNVKRVYVAGDDDQAIYTWSGADVATFLKLQGTQEILNQSYRLPSLIHTLSQSLITGVNNRFAKVFMPRSDIGTVQRHTYPDMVDLTAEGSWLFLARNVYQTAAYEKFLRLAGETFITKYGQSSVKQASYLAIRTWERLRKGTPQLGADIKQMYDYLRVGHCLKRGAKSGLALVDDQYYTSLQLEADSGLQLTHLPWHEALIGISLNEREYYLSVLRRHGTKALSTHPRMHVSTIHGAKGGEADNVVLLTDMAKKSYDGYRQQADPETRVFYVGVTRTKKALHIIQPQSTMFFNIGG
jgi:DNA helicase-2/ATP-dependent DNA helicase PcrA